MARISVIAERDFPVGTYSRGVDSFSAQVTGLRVTITRVAWPGVPADTVAELSVQWGTGEGAKFGLPGGQLFDRQGLPMNAQTLFIAVPRGANAGKRNVVDGVATFNVLQALRAAITVEQV